MSLVVALAISVVGHSLPTRSTLMLGKGFFAYEARLPLLSLAEWYARRLPLRLDALKQHLGRLVIRVLRHQLAPKRLG